MYNVQNLTNDVKTAKTNLTNIGIDMSNIVVTVKIDGRLTRACANCSYPKVRNNKRYATITFSPNYLASETPKEIWNTIYHELLHTLPDCHNHDKVWLHYADMVNKELGFNIQQYYVGKEYAPLKYQIKCPYCDRIVYRVSKQTQTYKRVKQGDKKIYCTRCGCHDLIAIEI